MREKVFIALVIALLYLGHISVNADNHIYYGYSPRVVETEEVSGYGSGKNNFLSVGMRFSTQEDSIWSSLKGKNVLGVRVYMRAEYKQKTKKWSCVEAYEGSLINDYSQQKYVNFVEGWNEVLFDEPIVISDNDLFLTANVFEVFGESSYPFCTIAGAEQAFYAKAAEEDWTKTNEHGALLIQAIVEADSTIMDNSAVVTFTETPMVVNPYSQFEATLYVCNTGNTNMESVVLTLSDGDISTDYTINFTTHLPAGRATTMQYSFKAGHKTGTNVDYTLSVRKINEISAKHSYVFHKDMLVTDDSFDRVPLIEEFTSQRCQNCPFMFYFLEEAMDKWKEEGNQIAYVAHHSGFVEDKFTSGVDRELLYLFGEDDSYNPAVMYDRRVFSGEYTPVHAAKNVAESDYYYDAISTVGGVAGMAKINIDIKKNEDNEDVVKVWGLLNKNIVNSE